MKRASELLLMIALSMGGVPPLSAAEEDPVEEAPAIEAAEEIGEKKEGLSDDQAHALFSEKEIYSREEVEEVQKLLHTERTVIQKRLTEERELLAQLKGELESKLGELVEVRSAIEQYLGKKSEAEQERIKKLSRYYENMDAEQAAPLLEKVEKKLVISIFEVMDVKKAGAILGLMEKEFAKEITERFPKLQMVASRGT